MGLLNLRDVGGLPTAAGGRVRTGALYRSDAPLPGDASPSLRPWPPRTVIDLRSPGEAREGRHPLAFAGTEVVSISLMPSLNPARMAQREEAPDLETAYRKLVERAARPLADVVRTVAIRPGPVLVHCAAGKDRTGIATAVTLAAVGVSRSDIVEEYLRSNQNMDGLPERLAQGWSDTHRDKTLERLTVHHPHLMDAPARAIEAVLDALDGWPGGARGWLLAHGVSASELELLEQKLTDAGPVKPAGPR